MSINWEWKDKQGSAEIYGKTVNLYHGNCLTIALNEWKDKDGTEKYSLHTFFADKVHLENMLKDGCLDEYSNWRLNSYFPDSITIAKLLCKYGHTVTLYYEKPKRG